MFVRTLLLVGLTISIFGCSSRWGKDKIAESKQRGDKIIAALESYKTDHGQYPPNLTVLVPDYLASVEPPTAGNQTWQYTVLKDGASFEIAFEGDSDREPSVFRQPEWKRWYVDDK